MNFIGISKSRFVFRGVGDSRFKLIPTALRTREDDKNSFDKLMRISGQTGQTEVENDEVTQRFREWRVVQRFYSEANLAGLRLPQLDHELHEKLLRFEDSKVNFRTELGVFLDRNPKASNVWPPKNLFSIFAIAQHHGLPTRFLDWSLDLNTAIYFAAENALRFNSAQFGVWLMPTALPDMTFWDTGKALPRTFRLLTVFDLWKHLDFRIQI
ncbi:MAG: FRG domain-containing protein [Pirellulaceae bacterium]